MRITVAQMNPTVGDMEGNFSKIVQGLEQVKKDGSDLVVFPELFLTGYPPKDLLERRWFLGKIQEVLKGILRLSTHNRGIGILFGIPGKDDSCTGKKLHNSAVLVLNGKIHFSQHKSLLPTYDVFDEARYFDHASAVRLVSFKGEQLGISICEDAWNDPDYWPGSVMYSFDPIEAMAQQGATLFINISASPFAIGKEKTRFKLIEGHAKRHKVPFLYVNQIGGNDELIFDGRSLFVDSEGRPVHVFPAFRERVETIDTGEKGKDVQYVPQERIESVYDALILGIRDYLRKCGFKKAVVGLSGGIDSSVTACLAAHALGKENVLGLAMPSQYSSKGSIQDSNKLSRNLDIPLKIISISGVLTSYLEALGEHFTGTAPDITEENIQARIRGSILMAFSNKFGHLVLSTGNKSELAVGYCTLYGDMSGGLAVISDVPKTMVYELARYINRKAEIIPREIIQNAPSAELKPNQRDQDTLPPYEILDKILYYIIEEGYGTDEVVEKGFDPETVRWVARAVAQNEYKRNQAAPGLKVTSKAFGVGRRFPIAARYEM
jgi:NAD+ synthase (glutamine-hydrolysing)